MGIGQLFVNCDSQSLSPAISDPKRVPGYPFQYPFGYPVLKVPGSPSTIADIGRSRPRIHHPPDTTIQSDR